MSIERFIDALDEYLAKGDRSGDDRERSACRERLVTELAQLFESHDQRWLSLTEDRFSQRVKGIRKNPLNRFLEAVSPMTKIAWSAEAHRKVTPLQYEAFTRNEEERSYAMDLVTRVELLSYAFDRLCELGIEHFEIHEEMKRNQPSPHGINLALIAPSVLLREDRWRKEVDVVTSFAHYEIKSVTDMLKQWGLRVNTPELQYIAKTRDRFLAHPQQGGVMRMAHRSLSIPFDGGPVKASVAGLDQWGPITRDYYLNRLNQTPPLDPTNERLANEQILLSSRQNHRLSQDDIVRLKAFGLREPDMSNALEELGELLQTDALPRIKTSFEDAVKAFGVE